MAKLYVIQPSFVGGEISEDVASRVDLDKYQMSLLQAENAVIRPYGAVRKRTGTLYCGACKYADRKVMLYKFDFTVEISYLLEIGDMYIRIWRDGRYLGVELSTPFRSADFSSLRFVQNVDVMYICSGKYPVKKLIRRAETSWSLQDVTWTMPPFNEINDDEDLTLTPRGTTGSITLSASKSYFTNSMIGNWLKLSQYINGSHVTLEMSNKDWTSGTSDSVRLIRYTDPVIVGNTWKIITHGTWKGKVIIEQSTDNGSTWNEIRCYSSNDDYNPTESDSVEEYCLMRVKVYMDKFSDDKNTFTVDFSSYAYTHEGYAKITGISSSTVAYAQVKKILGDTSATADFYREVWNSDDGYPTCATFFQDRLCFGGSDAHPQRVWMSRTGDYENFEVEKTSGEVLDDSAVTADLLSLKAYLIKHMSAGNDLIVTTEGNEWTISGSETVTPSSITPRNQQNYGSSDTLPIRVGNRIIYVQRRGSIVRDIGYDYNTDSYTGADLTLLAKHMVEGQEIVCSAYAQEPDSVIYFVRNDGTIICLTYIIDQKVFGWSRFTTDGTFESVASCQQGNNDVIYAVVKRIINGRTVRYIERFDRHRNTDNQQEHCIMDCAIRYELSTSATRITGLSNLDGKKVQVLADGYFYEELIVSGGAVTLPQPAKSILIGLPVVMILEQPNFDIGNGQDGTWQGRKKHVSSATLRLRNSYGGWIGPNKETLDKIIYETGRLELGENVLYSGDKKITIPKGGYDINGRVLIKHDTPYPMTISAIIREVTLGG